MRTWVDRSLSAPYHSHMHKRAHVAAARRLLASGDDASLPYAALELRMAMEAIAYAKLRAYATRVPEEAFAKWQAPQAVKALLQFEPHANREKRVVLRSHDATGASGTAALLGETRSFDLTWFRKSYNSLGSLLHQPSPTRASKAVEPASLEKVRATLTTILIEVERVAASTLEGGMAEVVYFSCFGCQQRVWCNLEAVRASRRAVCLYSSCSAVHTAELHDDGTISFLLDAVGTECPVCQSVTYVERRHLNIGFGFSCDACCAEYEISGVVWDCSPKPKGAAHGA